MLLFLTACQIANTTTADGDGVVTISGWLYEDPFVTESSEVITTPGSLEVLDSIGEPLAVDGESLHDGIQPFDGHPGYWRWWALPEQPYFLRIDGGEDYHPALWAGWAPTDNGIVQALIFGFETEDTAEWFAAISDATGLPLDMEGELVHLWGHFDEDYCALDGSEQDCPTVQDIEILSGPDGHVNVVIGFTVDPEDGTLVQSQVDPIRYFYAFNMEPNYPVDLRVTRDGAEVVQSYGPGPRDIIAAWYFEGP